MENSIEQSLKTAATKIDAIHSDVKETKKSVAYFSNSIKKVTDAYDVAFDNFSDMLKFNKTHELKKKELFLTGVKLALGFLAGQAVDLTKLIGGG